jgi:uncharacterized protein YbgA (DUF1722 family)
MAHGHWAYPVAWHYTEMGRLVAKSGTIPWEELSATYGRLFMEGLALLGTRRKHVNVLQHLMGYLKRDLSAEDKAYLRSVRAAGPYRGLSAGTGAVDRADDAAQASPQPLSSS